MDIDAPKKTIMKTFNYITFGFVVTYHLILIHNITNITINCIFPYLVIQFGIHAGFHRWISHKSFTPNRVVGFIICCCGCLGFQYGPLWWASQHKKHHSHCDSIEDIHTPNKSFFHSHIGWLLFENISKSNKDLILKWNKTNPEIVVLNNIYVYLSVNAIYCALLYNLNYSITNFYICPVVLVWHSTWATNSFCHKPTSNYICSPCDNFIVGIINLGEGFHKEHHTFPQKSCHGFRNWYQFDFTYMVLYLLNKLHLVKL